MLDRISKRYGLLPSEVLDKDILDFNINYYAWKVGMKKDIELDKKAAAKAKRR